MYSVIFEDNSEFFGGIPANSKWDEMPNKPIQSIEYSLLHKKIILTNYEAYNHLVERAQNLLSGQNFITKVLLMAKKQNKVLIIVFDFIKNSVYLQNVEFGKEYYNKSSSGWKQGLPNKNPTCNF
jgi:hypothetical protein